MFEQTFVDFSGNAARKPWPIALSFGGQTALIAVVLAVPLAQTAKLAWTPPVPLVFAPPKPLVARVVSVAPHAAQASPLRALFRPSFTAPTRIPSRIVSTPDPDPGAVLPQLASGGSYPDALDRIAAAPQIVVGAPHAVSEVHPVQKTASLRVSAGVQAAKLTRQVKPSYPALARAARISGTVRLQAVIGVDGRIRNLQLVSGPPLLVTAAVEAVKQWQYEPTLLNGAPVEVITAIDVNFTLNR